MAEPLLYVVSGLAGIFRRLPERTYHLSDLDRSLLISSAPRREVVTLEHRPIPISAAAILSGHPRAGRIYRRFLFHLQRAEAENRVLWIQHQRFALRELDGFLQGHGWPGLLALYQEAAEVRRTLPRAVYMQRYGRFDPTKPALSGLPRALAHLWPDRFTFIS